MARFADSHYSLAISSKKKLVRIIIRNQELKSTEQLSLFFDIAKEIVCFTLLSCRTFINDYIVKSTKLFS